MTNEEILQIVNDNPDTVIRYCIYKWPNHSCMHLSPTEWPFVFIRGITNNLHANIGLINAAGIHLYMQFPELMEFIDAENSRPPILK